MCLFMRGKLNIFAFMYKTFVIQVSLLRKFQIRTLRELTVFNFLESSIGFVYQIYFSNRSRQIHFNSYPHSRENVLF